MTEEAQYTTQLGAGLGLIDETKVLLGLWKPGDKTTDIIEKALATGDLPNITARRLRNIVSECFSSRFLKQHPPAAKFLKSFCCATVSSNVINQLFYLYAARSNLIFRDFVTLIYWDRYASGYVELDNESSFEFVRRASLDGKTKNLWSDSTIKRNASYLMSVCGDFNLLKQLSRSVKLMTPIRLQPITAVYLAYDLHLQGIADNNLINHPDWQLFGLQAEDVRDELKRLSVHKFWIIQAAADVVSISWAYKTMEEVVDVIIETGL